MLLRAAAASPALAARRAVSLVARSYAAPAGPTFQYQEVFEKAHKGVLRASFLFLINSLSSTSPSTSDLLSISSEMMGIYYDIFIF